MRLQTQNLARATGSIDTLMDRELFVESVGQLWDLDRVSATACFLAGDVDHSNRINAGEWLILREAFFHRSKECASHPAIRKLLLRAALYSYDVCKDGSLSNDFEVLLWLRDLCTGERGCSALPTRCLKPSTRPFNAKHPIDAAT